MNTMDKGMMAIWRKEESELKRRELAWISAGGSDDHFVYLRAFKPKFMTLLQHGPVGYGPLPDGCRIEVDKKWIVEEDLLLSHQVAIAPYRDAMFFWEAEWCHRNKVASTSIYFNMYPIHWHTEAVGKKSCHACWDLENGRVDLNLIRFVEYMRYLFLKGVGYEMVSEFECALGAIENGYWPIGIERGEAVVLKCNEDEISPRAKRRTSRK